MPPVRGTIKMPEVKHTTVDLIVKLCLYRSKDKRKHKLLLSVNRTPCALRLVVLTGICGEGSLKMVRAEVLALVGFVCDLELEFFLIPGGSAVGDFGFRGEEGSPTSPSGTLDIFQQQAFPSEMEISDPSLGVSETLGINHQMATEFGFLYLREALRNPEAPVIPSCGSTTFKTTAHHAQDQTRTPFIRSTEP
ncbi:hypothetical protein MJT46_013721 [Ovis ammon polii x Ovis aries]|nr:hypothetical protein MJT46_013721 [Ovis ammon polii x Ovis aries]